MSVVGYNIQNIPESMKPQEPENEFRYWYQYYFHNERGQAGLEQNRSEFCKFLWQLWSPNWQFDEMTYKQTASSFNNPDFVTYAESFGAKGYRIEKTEELLPTLKKALADNTVSVIDCPVDYRENLKLTEKLGEMVCQI